MEKIEQTLDSREVAEMVEKGHKELLRDIRRYCEQLSQSKIALPDFLKNQSLKIEERSIPVIKLQRKAVNLSLIS